MGADDVSLSFAVAELSLLTDHAVHGEAELGSVVRGLIGALPDGDPSYQNFISERFKGDCPRWRQVSGPLKVGSGVGVLLYAFGPQSRTDVDAIANALSRSAGAIALRFRGWSTSVRAVTRFKTREGTIVAPDPHATPAALPGTVRLHFLSPFITGSGHRPVSARDFVPTILFNSLRKRFSHLVDEVPSRWPACGHGIAHRLEVRELQQHFVDSGRRHGTRDLLGTVELSQISSTALAWLRVGEVIGLGRRTTFGAGHFLLSHAQ